jgi:[phosphatase 2A protein]-leucine-carboxy methyltransferase
VQDTDTDASLCRISAASLGYLNDPYAGEFVFVDRAVARKQPIINRGRSFRSLDLWLGPLLLLRWMDMHMNQS